MPLVMKQIIIKDVILPDESVAHSYQPYDKGETPHSSCKSSYSKGVKLIRYGSSYVHSVSNENDMKSLMVKRGPLTVAIDGEKLQNYDGTIITGSFCRNYELNHAVVLTAYDSEKYTLKNSWGGSWGVSGYFYLAPGQECIGIGTWCDACIAEPASGSNPTPAPGPSPGPSPGPNPGPSPSPTTPAPPSDNCTKHLLAGDWCAWAYCLNNPWLIKMWCPP